MADVLTRDGDVTFKDEDVTFDHELITLVVSGAYSACSADSFSILQESVLVTSSPYQVNASGSLVLSQEYVLTPSNCSSANVTETLSLEDVLFISYGTQYNVSGPIVLFQENVLSISSTYNVNTQQGLVLTLITEIEPDPVWMDTAAAVFKDTTDAKFDPHYLVTLELSDGTQVNASTTGAFTTEEVLSVNSAYSKTITDAITISEGIGFNINDGININAVAEILLSQEQNLVLSSAYHSDLSETLLIGIEYVLTVQDCYDATVSGTVLLEVAGIDYVAILDSVQSQYADSVVLLQEHVLSVNDALSITASDTASLTSFDTLLVQNGYSTQKVDALTLSELNNLVVSSAYDANIADTPAFTQIQSLELSDVANEQYSDGVSITQEAEDTLTVEAGVNSQLVDVLVLYQTYVAHVLDCSQIQSCGAINLSILQDLIVLNSEHHNLTPVLDLGFNDGFLGIVIDPYLMSLSVNMELHGKTPDRYLVQ